MQKLTLMVLVAAAAAQLSSATPTGAPETACESLVPGHGVEGQTGAAPYHIMTSANDNKTIFESKIFLLLMSVQIYMYIGCKMFYFLKRHSEEPDNLIL
jgi:hypothetical protein